MVSLWGVLSLFAGAGTVGGALAGAELAGGGAARFGLGVFLGLGLGVLSMAAIRTAGARVFRTLPPEDTSMREPVRLRLIYAAAFVWALVAGPVLGQWVAGSIIRFALP